VRTTGVVRIDETRLSDVNVKLDGWIRDLHVDFTGQAVQKGQPLFTLYSPDLLTTEKEYLLALKTRDQVKDSAIADAREYADRLVDAGRQRLRLWDLTAEDITRLEETREAPETMTFRSPVSGVVVEKQAVRGMHIVPGQTLYKVADLSVVWVEADVYEQEMALANVGQRALVTLDAYPGESFDGRAIYVYPFVEENTRTAKVRFQFPNASGRLKPGMFAHVELRGTSGMSLSVPANAVLDSGTEQIVFVARGEGRFTPRTVKVGRSLGDRIEIVDGLKEGEQVAVGATFFLDSESQLRRISAHGRSRGSRSTSSSARSPTRRRLARGSSRFA
jgi:RND family efflux transporter MFP subunit